jgi:MSHA biogenesis protein MshL
MKPGLNLLIALLALFFAGCASHRTNPGGTFDRVNQELKDAAGAKSKNADDALSQAMMPPLQVDLPTSAKNVEPRFDLAVSNAPASQVFMALVTGTRYSMLVAPEVSGNVTVNLKSVTVREALETIRELYGYEFKFQGTRIYIQSNAMQTRIFQINYLSSRRQGQSEVRVTSSSITSSSAAASGGGAATTPAAGGAAAGGSGAAGASSGSGTTGSRISTSSDSDFWKELTQALTAIVGTADGRSVIISPGSGVVLVKAFPADIRSVESYLRATQVIVERQVMLEAKIIEVSLSEDYQAGVNWSAFGGSQSTGGNRVGAGVVGSGSTLNTTGALSSTGVSLTPGAAVGTVAATAIGKGFFGLAFQTANFATLLNFLESQGNVQVLSSPRIATINNQKAVLKVGSDEFYVTNVSTSTTASGTSTVTTPTITLQPFFSGIALDVTPQIDEGNNIILHVHPTISVVAEKQKTIDLGSLGAFVLPLATSTVNETDSIVRVQDGHIVAIGGLMKQEQASDRNGLPGTGGVSGIGALFGQRTSLFRKREVVILIKPTVIRNESSWKDDLIETQNRVEQLDPRRFEPQ